MIIIDGFVNRNYSNVKAYLRSIVKKKLGAISLIFIFFMMSCNNQSKCKDEVMSNSLIYDCLTYDTLNLIYLERQSKEITDSFQSLVFRDFRSDSLLRFSFKHNLFTSVYELNANTLSLTSYSDATGYDTLLFLDSFRLEVNSDNILVLKYNLRYPGYDQDVVIFWTMEYGRLAFFNYSWGMDNYLLRCNDVPLNFKLESFD